MVREAVPGEDEVRVPVFGEPGCVEVGVVEGDAVLFGLRVDFVGDGPVGIGIAAEIEAELPDLRDRGCAG